MLGFLKKKTALLWAKYHCKKAEQYKNNAIEYQEKLLFSLIKKAENTRFGKEHTLTR